MKNNLGLKSGLEFVTIFLVLGCFITSQLKKQSTCGRSIVLSSLKLQYPPHYETQENPTPKNIVFNHQSIAISYTQSHGETLTPTRAIGIQANLLLAEGHVSATLNSRSQQTDMIRNKTKVTNQQDVSEISIAVPEMTSVWDFSGMTKFFKIIRNPGILVLKFWIQKNVQFLRCHFNVNTRFGVTWILDFSGRGHVKILKISVTCSDTSATSL